VRVQVVAEKKGRVAIGGIEQPWAPVVGEVALVDRLQAERVPLLAERREDGLGLALDRRLQRLAPETALALGLERDPVPDLNR
jgi:hypothetical protein